MGTCYQFTCLSCNYTATVSGGPTWGMLIHTTTIHCLDCHYLYDAIDSEGGPGPTVKPVPIHCPRSKKHQWQLWTFPGPCPRCGQPMTRSSDNQDLIWD